MVIGIVDKLKELLIEAECDAAVAALEVTENLAVGKRLEAIEAFTRCYKAEKLAHSIYQLVSRFDESSVGASLT